MANYIRAYSRAFADVEMWFQLAIIKLTAKAEFDFADVGIKMETEWDAPVYSNFCYKSSWESDIL